MYSTRLVSFLFLLSFLTYSSLAQTVYDGFEDGQLFIRIKADQPPVIHAEGGSVDINQFDYLHSVKQDYVIRNLSKPFYRAGTPKFERTLLLEFADYEHVDYIIRELESKSEIEFVEKIPLNIALSSPPDDRFYHPDTMYHLFLVGAEKAWGYSLGDKEVIIAVADDAVNWNHDDLKANVYKNTAEINGTPGVDDDGNGYKDDKYGWDVPNRDGDPSPPDVYSKNWIHGNHTAGIAAGVTDNRIGISSISHNCTLLPVRGKSDNGNYPATDTYAMVEYAVKAGADVISMSWGQASSLQIGQDMMDYAHENGVVLVAAAGNQSSEQVLWPGKYNHVICVANTDANDRKYSTSSYGPDVDISAPGEGILSCVESKQFGTVTKHGYNFLSGTSFACPLVAGACGLMLSYNPDLTPDEIESILKSTSYNHYPKNGAYTGKLGAGRLDVGAALEQLFFTSVREEEGRPEVKIFPNPSTGIIRISGGGQQVDQVIVYDVTGRLVGAYPVKVNQIDLSQLGAGSFILTFLQADNLVGTSNLILSN